MKDASVDFRSQIPIGSCAAVRLRSFALAVLLVAAVLAAPSQAVARSVAPQLMQVNPFRAGFEPLAISNTSDVLLEESKSGELSLMHNKHFVRPPVPVHPGYATMNNSDEVLTDGFEWVGDHHRIQYIFNNLLGIAW